MRSSIACVRCRKSKVKCLNAGTDAACRSCATSGRECIYPAPASAQSHSTPKRSSEVPGGLKMDGESEAKRARKREVDSSRKLGIRSGEDPLESPPITPRMWNDIYSLFMLHCSTELPFLHQETFHSCVRQPPASRSPETKLFLLGILTLTARFMPELVQYHSPSEPLAASEFYAEACASRLAFNSLTKSTSLERLQTLLMLSFYHWGQWRGMQARAIHYNSCRLVETLKLYSESGLDEEQSVNTSSLLQEPPDARSRDSAPKRKMDAQSCIGREIKRRTVYSLFILDRHFSAGHGRRQIFSMDMFSVQLPCSDSFRYGADVKTPFLKDSMEALEKADMHSQGTKVDPTQLLSIYIQLVEIWGRLSAWSCAGGRRSSNLPPWHEKSEVFQLRKLLENFQASLDPRLTFSATNLSAQIGEKTLPLYTSIHVLYFTCTIALHREYIPHVPLRCKRPSGPLDPPLIPEDAAHEGYFAKSAEILFQAARNVMSIIYTTSYHSVFVESPTVVFGLWTAAFTGLYSKYFPHMDPASSQEKALEFENSSSADPWAESLKMAYKTLEQVMPKIQMAKVWKGYLNQMEDKYIAICKEYEDVVTAPSMQNAEYGKRLGPFNTAQSIREGGGGLEDYKLIEQPLKDFGPTPNDCPQEDRATPDLSETYDSPISRSSTRTPHVKIEATPARDSASSNGPRSNESSWAAVNNSHLHTHSHSNSDEYRSQGFSVNQNPGPTINSPTYYPRTAQSSISLHPQPGPARREAYPANGYRAMDSYAVERAEQFYQTSDQMNLGDLNIDSFNTGVMYEYYNGDRVSLGDVVVPAAHGGYLAAGVATTFESEPRWELRY